MAGMGPAPKPADQRRRRNVKPVAMKLPAGGRVGPVPKFPIPLFDSGADSVQRQVRKLEAELWKELWRLPQAVAWEQIGYTREVAQYVRWKVRGELGELEAAKEARQLSDRLGLSPLAMLRNQWAIDDRDEVGDMREQRSPRGSTKARGVRAVDTA